jgi:peroxidase
VDPENKKVKTGTNVVLLCDAEGVPEPVIFWSKNEHPLKYTNRIFLSTDNKTLNIDHIKESDAGVYTCVAENILGADEVSTHVEVLNSHGPPVLLFEPYDLEAIPGTTIELPCGAEQSEDESISQPVVSLSSHAKLHLFRYLSSSHKDE